MAAAVEPRLRAHVIALAGGSIPDILLTSKDSLLTKPLANYLAKNQMAVETLERLLRQHVKTDPIGSGLVFFLVYVAVTGLSLPGAAVMTLIAGAIFGLLWGTVIVSFASTLGATLAFLASRFLLREWVQGKFGDKLKPINDGVAREGAFYLFALRLVPAFPFFVINLVMGLTPIRTWTFYWVSQIGMLAGTIAYVYAGTQLGEFRISVGLLVAFAILGIFPLAAKKALDAIKARRVYARWTRPARWERKPPWATSTASCCPPLLKLSPRRKLRACRRS